MANIETWLQALGLGKYTERFVDNEIDLNVLAKLTDDDLRELDLPIGPRRMIRDAIDDLTAGDSPMLTKPVVETGGTGASAATSRSCSATWSVRRRCQDGSTRKI